MTEAFMQFTLVEASARLEQAGVTYSRVQPMADVLTDEQLRANGIVVETGDTGEGYELTIASPINVREAPKKAPSRAPDVGADSVEVLRGLGFEETYVQELVSSKVVVTAESGS